MKVPAVAAFFTGLLLAGFQLGYFFLLQAMLSSSYSTYVMVLFGWLGGSLIGLWIKREGLLNRWLLASLASFYLLYLVLRAAPYQQGLAALYVLLVGVSGCYAGYFFRVSRRLFEHVGSLFFHENNGFILGMILCFVGFAMAGQRFLLIGLPILVLACFLLNRMAGQSAVVPARPAPSAATSA